MSNSVRPCRRQPTRLPGLWDSPGKNTGVGCHFLLQCMKVKSQSEVAQSCPTLLDPMDCSLPGSSVHGIFQGRVPEWVAIAFSDSEPSASYLLSKWIVNEWMQPLHRWPICSVVLSKFIVRLGAFVLFWCLHWPVTLALKCWFYSETPELTFYLDQRSCHKLSFLPFSSAHFCSWNIDWGVSMKKLNFCLPKSPIPVDLLQVGLRGVTSLSQQVRVEREGKDDLH